MEKIRGNIKGIVWLDEFAFDRYSGKFYRAADIRNLSLEYNLRSKFINLELLKRNNKIRIKEFVRYSYGGK